MHILCAWELQCRAHFNDWIDFNDHPPLFCPGGGKRKWTPHEQNQYLNEFAECELCPREPFKSCLPSLLAVVVLFFLGFYTILRHTMNDDSDPSTNLRTRPTVDADKRQSWLIKETERERNRKSESRQSRSFLNSPVLFSFFVVLFANRVCVWVEFFISSSLFETRFVWIKWRDEPFSHISIDSLKRTNESSVPRAL